MKQHIDYLYALDYRKARRAIAQAVKRLDKIHFDAIAFTGHSGSLIAPAVAYEMGKGLIVVKKNLGHSSYRVEGAVFAAKYVILDDFISSGDTIRRIARTLRKNDYAKYAELVGIYEYATSCKMRGRFHVDGQVAIRDKYVSKIVNDVFTKYGVK